MCRNIACHGLSASLRRRTWGSWWMKSLTCPGNACPRMHTCRLERQLCPWLYLNNHDQNAEGNDSRLLFCPHETLPGIFCPPLGLPKIKPEPVGETPEKSWMLIGLEDLSYEGRLRDLKFSLEKRRSQRNILAAYHTLKGVTRKMKWNFTHNM